MSSKPTKPQRPPTDGVVEVQDLPHFTVETACLNCKADMRGEWIVTGQERYTLECPACGQSHILDIVEKHESKPTSVPKPARPATSDEMRLALSRLASVRQHLTLLRDDDDPVAVLEGVIDELLHKRHAIADVQQWMQTWQAENVRR